MKLIRYSTFVLTVFCFCVQPSIGQILCVANNLKITTVKGIVVFRNQTILSNLIVKLRKATVAEELIEETKSNEKGEFHFDNIRWGNYRIEVPSKG